MLVVVYRKHVEAKDMQQLHFFYSSADLYGFNISISISTYTCDISYHTCFSEEKHSSLPMWFSVKAKFNPQPTPAFSPERHGAVQCGSFDSWFLWPQRGMVHRRRSGGVSGYKSDPFTLRNISKELDSYLQSTSLQVVQPLIISHSSWAFPKSTRYDSWWVLTSAPFRTKFQ